MPATEAILLREPLLPRRWLPMDADFFASLPRSKSTCGCPESQCHLTKTQGTLRRARKVRHARRASTRPNIVPRINVLELPNRFLGPIRRAHIWRAETGGARTRCTLHPTVAQVRIRCKLSLSPRFRAADPGS